MRDGVPTFCRSWHVGPVQPNGACAECGRLMGPADMARFSQLHATYVQAFKRMETVRQTDDKPKPRQRPYA